MIEKMTRGNLRSVFTESQVDVIKRTMGQMLIIVIGILVTFSLANAKDGPIAMSSTGIAAVTNVIEEPAYSEAPEPVESPNPEAKVQYAPATDDLPVLEDRKVSEGEVNGATYTGGEDQVISPQSSVLPKDEPIEELDTAPVVLN